MSLCEGEKGLREAAGNRCQVPSMPAARQSDGQPEECTPGLNGSTGPTSSNSLSLSLCLLLTILSKHDSLLPFQNISPPPTTPFHNINKFNSHQNFMIGILLQPLQISDLHICYFIIIETRNRDIELGVSIYRTSY